MFFSTSLRTRFFLLLFFALLAAPLLAPIYSNDHVSSAIDLYNHTGLIVQATHALEQGQFPLRIAPDEYMHQYYPNFQFYAPSGYLYAAFINKWLTHHNPIHALKLSLWFAFIFGAAFTFRLTKWLTQSSHAGLLGATVFLTAPYWNTLIGHLGGFQEVLGLCLLPFIYFYALKFYFEKQQFKHFLWTSLGIYLLITTHIITFMFGSLFIAILLFLCTLKTRQWKSLIRTGIAFFCGSLMACWFLAPAYIFSKQLLIAGSFSSADNIFKSSTSISSLLSSSQFKLFGNGLGTLDLVHQTLGIPIIIAFFTACYALLNHLVIKKTRVDNFLYAFIYVFSLVFFITWTPFNFWKWLPSLFLVIQYGIRGLGHSILLGAILFAWVSIWLFDHKLDKRHVVLGIFLILAASNSLIPNLAPLATTAKDIKKNPTSNFNAGSYLLDAMENTTLVHSIDSFAITQVLHNDELLTNTPYNMPYSLLKLAYDPHFKLKAKVISKVNHLNQYQLSLMIGKNLIKSQTLDHQQLKWDIDLKPFLKAFSKKETLPIFFVLNKRDEKTHLFTHTLSLKEAEIKIQVEDVIAITHYLNKAETYSIDQVKPHCLAGNVLSCQLVIPAGIKQLQLPIFYYPNMLSIYLNGKKIEYTSVLTNSVMMTSIEPQAGEINKITAEFTGLGWANKVSIVASIMWLMAVVGYLNSFRSSKI